MKQSVDVHNFLQNNDVLHEIFLMETPPKNSKQAAAVLGLRPKEVVESIIIFVNKKPTVAIIPSNKELDINKLTSIFPDSKIKLASSHSTLKTTGFVAGTIPPVAHETSCRTLIDKECMKLDVLYARGGELNAMLKIRPHDLQKLTKADVLDISK